MGCSRHPRGPVTVTTHDVQASPALATVVDRGIAKCSCDEEIDIRMRQVWRHGDLDVVVQKRTEGSEVASRREGVAASSAATPAQARTAVFHLAILTPPRGYRSLDVVTGPRSRGSAVPRAAAHHSVPALSSELPERSIECHNDDRQI